MGFSISIIKRIACIFACTLLGLLDVHYTQAITEASIFKESVCYSGSTGQVK